MKRESSVLKEDSGSDSVLGQQLKEFWYIVLVERATAAVFVKGGN